MRRNSKKKFETKSLPKPKFSREGQTYKVRAALTCAHYIFVEAKSPNEAERKVRKHIMDIEKHHGGYDWYGEASHMHTSYEVEEAE